MTVQKHFSSFWTASNLATDMVFVPLVVSLSNGSGRFENEHEKRSFLHWMYAALLWGRYSGSTETKLHKDLEALKSEDPPSRMRDNIIAERGRIRVEAADLAGHIARSPMFAVCYVVSSAKKAVDWFNGLPLYQELIGKSHGLQYHHIFPRSLLYSGVRITAKGGRT
jgi:hypothetical protein|tara:strand:+ start:86 stop:586 length:501 start_codon:yes stop_codon:yes gene_type:complete